MGFVKLPGRLLARVLAFIFHTAKWGSRAGGCQNDADPEPTREPLIHLRSGPDTDCEGVTLNNDAAKWLRDLCVRLFIYLQTVRPVPRGRAPPSTQSNSSDCFHCC